MSVTYNEYGIPFRELARIARGHSIVLSAILVVSVGAALAVALLSQRVYRSEVTVALATPEGNPMPALGQFQGVAQAVGLNFGPQGNRGELVAILRSRLVAQQVIQRHQLVPALLKPDEDGKYAEPALQRAVEKFQVAVTSVDLDRLTSLVTIGIKWPDPVAAAAWASFIVEEANRITRQRAIKDTELALQYLNDEATKATSLELKQAIYSLIEAQMNRRMLANVRPEYAFITIDPAVVPFRSIWPRRQLIVAGGILIGLILGGAYLMLLAFLNRNRSSARTQM
jgi:uncharacterized protein involved in exopolysaccharide biosynthesis